MAHQIEAKDNMVYVGATPWHGLGQQIPQGTNPDQIAEMIGANIPIEKRRVYVRQSAETSGLMNIPNVFAVMRQSDHQYYGVVSERYHVVQNPEILGFFKEYTEAGDMHMETAGTLRNGGVIWALANINSSFTLAGGDKVGGYVLLANSHDGTITFQGMFTSIRVVCHNTLSAAIGSRSGKMFKFKHSKKITPEVIADAKRTMGLAKSQMERMSEWAYPLSEARVTLPEALVYVGLLTDKKGLQDKANELNVLDTRVGDILTAKYNPTPDQMKFMIDLLGSKLQVNDLNRVGQSVISSSLDSPGASLASARGTWWGLVNGVTHHVDHEAGRSNDTSLYSAWFGVGASLKEQAAQVAYAYIKR